MAYGGGEMSPPGWPNAVVDLAGMQSDDSVDFVAGHDDSLTATVTGVGDIFVQDIDGDGVTLNGLSTTGSGIDVEADGTITISSAVAAAAGPPMAARRSWRRASGRSASKSENAARQRARKASPSRRSARSSRGSSGTSWS